MNNIERIFEAVCNILSVYVSFKVTDVFLEKKRKLPRMANIVYVIVWLINTIVAFGFRNAMGTTVSMVLLLWEIFLCFPKGGQWEPSQGQWSICS